MNGDTTLESPQARTSPLSLGFDAFIIVRSKTDNDALVRLQSEPIMHGLQNSGLHVSLHIPNPEKSLVVDRPSCLIFHYDDQAAVQTIRLMQGKLENLLVICLGSDIYSFSDYTNLHDIVNLYVMPTDIHRKILAGGVYKPVYVLNEGIDPISIKAGEEHRKVFPQKAATRLLWFGYSESFAKSMKSLIPIIMKNVTDHHIEDFAVIVDQERFRAAKDNPVTIWTIPYDNTTFSSHAKNFDYAILSHLPLDLKLNTYIKSPNKFITALLAGLIPIASDTPNYREVAERFGLQKFLFSSAQELDNILKALDPVADSQFIQESGAVLSLLEAGSPAIVASDFLQIIERFLRDSDLTINNLPLVPYIEARRPILLREHLSDLMPSAARAFRSRFSRVLGSQK